MDADEVPLSSLKQRRYQQQETADPLSGSSDDDKHPAKQDAATNSAITTKASAKSDSLAIRCRTRRERPPKLRISNISDRDGGGEANDNEFDPDIESFVSACIPTSFTAGTNERSTSDVPLSQRRTKLIHKRSLPLLSFLSSTHLAAAEKRRKKEAQERRNAIAEKEAKKALLRNP